MIPTLHRLFLALALALAISLVVSERKLSVSSESLEWNADSESSSEAALDFAAYIDGDCQTTVLNAKLIADYSLCQAVTAAGFATYIRADCFANDTFYGTQCTDPACTSCNPFPQTPSNVCTPYDQGGIVKAIKAVCPNLQPLDAPMMTPDVPSSVTPTAEPESPPLPPPAIIPASPPVTALAPSSSFQLSPAASLTVTLLVLVLLFSGV